MKNPDLFKKNVPGTTEVLNRATVGIAGCGGLGSNAAIALTRAGVGRLILADFDVVEESNLNRQYYFQEDIGEKKVNALSRRLQSINPLVKLTLFDAELTSANAARVFTDADILIEGFDKAASKSCLIETWRTAFPTRPIVCASGLSGTGKTEALKVQHRGTIHIVGDGESDMNAGLCAARVAIAANMEANIAIELLLTKEK